MNPQTRVRRLALVLSLGALGTTTTCAECDPPTGFDPPTLFFEGRVVDTSGQGLVAVVTSEQRLPDCEGFSVIEGSTAATGPDGSFRTDLYAAGGLDGCFVLRAASAPDGLPLDSVRLAKDDLDALGDPLGTGVIQVDIVVRRS